MRERPVFNLFADVGERLAGSRVWNWAWHDERSPKAAWVSGFMWGGIVGILLLQIVILGVLFGALGVYHLVNHALSFR